MTFARRTLAICLAFALGFGTTILLAAGLSVSRPPVTRFSGQIVAQVAHPVTLGPTTYPGYDWVFDDVRRFGERTLMMISVPTLELRADAAIPRPPIAPDVDSFLDRAWRPPYADEHPTGNALQWARLYGWPMRCLWFGEISNQYGPTDKPHTPGWFHGRYGGYQIGQWRGAPRVLPLRPLLPGLIVNGIVFAGAWLLASFGPGAARRVHRLRRGLCPACAYDLRATPPGSPCPECGQIPTIRHGATR